MSEEIDLGANNITITEDAFEKFQSNASVEEDEFFTLSDIVPPQPSVPDLSQELNEIPFDNEVVLDSSHDASDDQRNRLVSVTQPQLLDISDNNVLGNSLNGLEIGGEDFQDDDLRQNSNSRSLQQNNILSADGLGAQNYVLEDSAAIIQDSLLSTTVGQSDNFPTNSEEVEGSKYPRRTKRGRIPNSVKYPMTSAASETGSVSKRRPGRPKKASLVPTTFEPDSTNTDSNGLFPENGSANESSGLEETTLNSARKSGRRGKPRTLKKNTTPTPSRRGLKATKTAPLVTNENLNDKPLVESSEADVNIMDLDATIGNDYDKTSGTSKRKRGGRTKGKKAIIKKTQTKSDILSCQDDDIENDDDADDICLSKLKHNPGETSNVGTTEQVGVLENSVDFTTEVSETENIVSTNILQNEKVDKQDNTEEKPVEVLQNFEEPSPSKRNSKMPIMSDFEYNIDKVVKEATTDEQPMNADANACLLVEDTSKRRRTAKKNFVYDEGSDEDPFANVESSDDEPKLRKKGSRYMSDDEYVPGLSDAGGGSGRKRGKIPSSSDSEEIDEFDVLAKKKKTSLSTIMKPLDNKTLVTTIKPNKAQDDDIEVCLQTSVIKTDDALKPPAEAWATSNAFETFIAQKNTSLKIKKVSSQEKTDVLAPLEIPILDPKELKKSVEASTQTKKASTLSMGVQTSAPYDIPMKTNINLSAQESEKACQFLSSVVKTTVELGELMSQKSEDFMKKKINTENVTDTFKMDYCVRKSFLLFKLAKHNLLQMEEDLAKQYDQFLEENNLSSCREQPKKVVPKATKADSDSDCEIVEVLGVTGSAGPSKKEKPVFNPKTVILNKELSIKITKKPPAAEKPSTGKKKLEIKGRHAVWINKNVMVKKVTPKQSFLAQDSRNKKPPDTFVTEKMVSDFFKGYYREKALSVCMQFVNTDWSCVQREYACHYFVNELDGANASRNNNELSAITTENDTDAPDENYNTNALNNNEGPKSLFTLCTEAISNCFHGAKTTQKQTCNVADGTVAEGPVTLFRLCINALRNDPHHISVQNSTRENPVTEEENDMHDLPDDFRSTECESEEMDDMHTHGSGHPEDKNLKYDMNSLHIDKHAAVLPLTSLCYSKVVELISKSYQDTIPNNLNEKESDIRSIDSYQSFEEDFNQELVRSPINQSLKKVVNTLFSLCVQLIQRLHEMSIKTSDDEILLHSNAPKLKPLKSIAFESIRNIMFAYHTEKISELIVGNEVSEITDNFTINCINTLSEEAFERLQVPVGKRESPHYSDGFEDDLDDCDNDEVDFNPGDENETDDNGWAAQLQMQELRSCYTPNLMENIQAPQESHEVIGRVKLEPIDDFTDNIVDTSIIKSEPVQSLQALNEMTHIPDSIVTKTELVETTNNRDGSPQIPGTASYNVDNFEQIIRSNKMIYSMDEANDEIFSQSGLRIRRQHEPDIDQGYDTSMSLLVPHTFEPLHIVEAKGCLMESSSDDNGSSKKNTGKKKLDKKKKKTKKDLKTSKETPVVKETPATVMKEKTIPENEVAILTRKMREKIRQEEKKIESSDSEAENLYMLSAKKDKSKKENDKKSEEHEKIKLSDDESDDTLYKLNTKNDLKDTDKIEFKKLPKNKQVAKNNSVENKQVVDEIQCNNVDSTEKILEHSKKLKAKDMFSGFTAIDQNEISNYYKMTKIVYNQIMPSDIDNDGINMDDSSQNASSAPIIHPNEPVELLECEPTMPIFDEEPYKHPGPKKSNNKNKKKTEVTIKPQFTDRHGWHCYSIDSSDTKLYKDAQILLEKLPESFVETYMEYQDVMDKDVDDNEVDRLVNLHSLNRSINTKELKIKSRSKGSKEPSLSGTHSRSHSPANSDHFDELAPSDDEIPNIDDEVPPPVPVRSSENNLAKNLLMDDHDSDSDGGGGKKIKEEPKDHVENVQTGKPKKAGPKSKTKLDNVDPESLMLTADKMMNKELTLLHAPIVLQDNAPTTIGKGSSPKEDVKPSKKISTKQAKERVKNDDDSSSEEEKQWVSTKEKLLKRMGKKEDAVADDAKRAKLVTEFIERRSVPERKNTRQSGDGRRERAKKKMLERQKQLRFLKNELFRENAEGIGSGKRGAAAGLFKGRKNIRAVIDKKSLARSTVVANMEEFERKRRLNMRQNKLREVLGCEEGVNVLVINDEVCLEYDFAQQRPVVTVHPFFTKVMKAHQYEGVKFMWDACFESLATLESGHPGGGCILAHCMGLGKTLQVLALLHTVLTHPRAGMHRVLVCCPLSTVLNWVDEIHKWIGPVTHQIKVFELSKLRKTYERAYQLEDWYSGGGIFIIGYELFRSLTTLDPDIDEVRPTIINKIRTALLDPGPDIIVCDEGHLLKNDCSVLAVAMSRVVTKRRIVLTGTPMQNNLREYFCMVNFIKPNLLGTYSEYSNRFENPIMNGQHRDSRSEDIKLMKARTHILHKVLEGCLQRQEASVLYPYLPKKHEYTVFIPLTQCQWDLYNHYMDKYARSSKQSVLKDFHILQKIWSHPQVLHNFHMKSREKRDKIKAEKIEDDLAHEDLEDIKPPETEVWWLQYLNGGTMLDSLDSSNKFVAVFRILHECVSLGDKVLIFSTSLFCLDALEFFLKNINEWSLGHDYYRLDGSVPAEVRQKWCREFNAENNLKTKLFLISTRAGCLGLNMTAANRVIILDTSWNPAHDIQSIFRVYRFGQKKDCYIYRLVALGTMEQKIYERSVTKQAVACRVVDEQQIDRHYNLAELTELYSVDEQGHSVAGGVAVGVCDVALLRVARDAAVHAVHEHDSLLRGSSEQGLPEHERAAAWNQFQQEHEHKQMQNDLNANKAVVALKRLEMEHLRQQAMYNDNAVKIEPGTDNNSLLVPMVGQINQRGKKPKITTIMQCRVSSEPQPGPSALPVDTLDSQQAMVSKITNLLIKHNFMQHKSGPKKIAELVSKVKKMVATGQPMTLGPGYDELSSSIANVLLHREEPPMPALTDVVQDITPVDDPPETRKRGRPKKSAKEITEIPPPPIVPVVENTMAIEMDGRMRRKAALAAEKQFEPQQDIIDLDGDDGDDRDADASDDWQVDAEYIEDDEPVIQTEPEPQKQPEKPPKTKPKKKPNTESSIVLSDDEPVQVTDPAPTPAPVDNDVVPLHPSLLTNSNFIKIVAHTYLAGNPMMDEDAATLAAQYSTLKTLKEAEADGKQIESGPVYDIAIQVLGKEVLRKLQAANPKVQDSSGDSSLTANKLQSLLGASSETPRAPTPPVKKPKIGPKSKMLKDVKQEPKDSPSPAVSTRLNVNTPTTSKIAIGQAKPAPFASSAAAPPPRTECILPDDDEVIASEPVDRKPILLKKFAIDRSLQKDAKPSPGLSVTPVALLRRTGVPQATPPQAPPSNDTICLDSDDEEGTPAPLPHRLRVVQVQTSAPEPVPVALTGPNVRPIALSAPAMSSAPPVHNLQPTLYTLSPCGTKAIPVQMQNQAVPKSTLGAQSQPVPISLTGPGMQPVSFRHDTPHPAPLAAPGPLPVHHVNTYKGKGRLQPVSMSFGSGPVMELQPLTARSQPVPISWTGPGSHPVPISLVGPDSQTMPLANPQPVPISLVDANGQPVSFTSGGSQSATPMYQRFSKQQTQATATLPNVATPRILRTQQALVSSQVSPPTPAPNPSNKSRLIPGDVFRISKSGLVEILNHKLGKTSSSEVLTHTTLGEPPPLTPKPIAPKPATPQPAAVATPPPDYTQKEPTRRQSVRSVSSSSSGSSRSASPNPLDILKDVVHIQAPEKPHKMKLQTKHSTTTKASSNVTPSTSKTTSNSGKTPANTRPTGSVGKSGISKYATADLKRNTGLSKLTQSVDLTQLDERPTPRNVILKGSSQNTSTKGASKPGSKGKTNTTIEKKKETPSKLVGTSKSIILDGKSKSLKVEGASSNKTTVSNPSVSNAASRQRPVDKRPAVAASTPAPKKKKTEPMTLKDFDIDDIDDIIELD